MLNKVKIGLVGAGSISRAYVSAIAQVAECELTGVADIDSNKAGTLATEAGCQAVATHAELVKKLACEAVIVCTPPESHLRVTEDLLELGAHVLCEKPLSTDSTSARSMLSTARSSNRILTMGSKFRYVEDVVKAKRIVASGILGEIILFSNVFTAKVDMSQRWNSNPSISGGGVLIDNGTHSIDIIRYFLGPISEVDAIEGKRLQSSRVEDTAQLFARSVDGVMASAELSWNINKESPSYIEIYGSLGTVKVGWQGSQYRQNSSTEWVSFGSGYDKIQAFSSQIRNFCRTILGQEALVITPEDALASVEVIEAAYHSMRQNDWVKVKTGGVERRDTPRLVEVAS